jgi:hypothetical protein
MIRPTLLIGIAGVVSLIGCKTAMADPAPLASLPERAELDAAVEQPPALEGHRVTASASGYESRTHGIDASGSFQDDASPPAGWRVAKVYVIRGDQVWASECDASAADGTGRCNIKDGPDWSYATVDLALRITSGSRSAGASGAARGWPAAGLR